MHASVRITTVLRLFMAAIAGLLAAFPAPTRAGDAPPAPSALAATTVLDIEQGSFVGFARWKTPWLVAKEGKIVPLLEPARSDLKEEDRKPWPVVAADPPAKDWASPNWKNARIDLANPRCGTALVEGLWDRSPLVIYRMISEAAIQGTAQGIGRLGGDFWPLPGKEGRFLPLCTGYGGCAMSENTLAMTSPGADGAIFNERLEMFREGVQVAEAIGFVNRALDAGTIEGDLAKRAVAVLDECARYYLRTRPPTVTNRLSLESSNCQERDSRLFALAAEVAASNSHNK